MILEKITAVKQLNDRKHTYDDAKATGKNLKDTSAEFDKIKKALRNYWETYDLIYERLDTDNCTQLNSYLTKLYQQFLVIENNFNEQNRYRAVKELQTANGIVSEFRDYLLQSWRDYFGKATAQEFNLARLLIKLFPPDEQAELNKLGQMIQHWKETLPQEEKDLNEFDEALQKLGQWLNSVSGLTPEVEIFLQKTLQDRATLADYTPTVQEWCETHQYTTLFQISLKGNA